MSCCESGSVESVNRKETDPVRVEYMIVDEEDSRECVLVPESEDDEAIATQWIAAESGSFVSLTEMQ